MQYIIGLLMGVKSVGRWFQYTSCKEAFKQNPYWRYVFPCLAVRGKNVWLIRILFRYNESQRRHGALEKPEKQDSVVHLIMGTTDNAAKTANNDNQRSKAEKMLRARKNV